MARIFKGSRYQLQLLVSHTNSEIEDVKIDFFTTDANQYVEVTEDITIKGNIANVIVGSTLFDNLEDGVLNYIISGTIDGTAFMSERQSNYYLKSDTQGNAGNIKIIIPIYVEFADQTGNSEMVIRAQDYGADGFNEVQVNANNYGWERYSNGYNDGYELGRNETTEVKLEHLNADFNDMDGNGNCWWYPHEQDLDGFNYVHINASEYGNIRYQQGYNDAGGSANLEDKWITASWEDVIDDDLYLVYPTQSEEVYFQGMARVIMERGEASAPNWMYGLCMSLYGDALTKGETIETEMYYYIIENNGSLSGFFDDEEFTEKYEWWRSIAFTREQGWGEAIVTDMSYMYNGNDTIPIVAFKGFDCTNVENVEGAFNGWNELHSLDVLYNLGASFKTEQTIDFSMTHLNDNPNTQILIKTFYDFRSENEGNGNQYGVTTSYVKGLSNFREKIEDRGWVCID